MIHHFKIILREIKKKITLRFEFTMTVILNSQYSFDKADPSSIYILRKNI